MGASNNLTQQVAAEFILRYGEQRAEAARCGELFLLVEDQSGANQERLVEALFSSHVSGPVGLARLLFVGPDVDLAAAVHTRIAGVVGAAVD